MGSKHLPLSDADLRWRLCVHDRRHPLFGDLHGDDEPDEIPEPMRQEPRCACDSCHSATAPLADELLDLRQSLGPLADYVIRSLSDRTRELFLVIAAGRDPTVRLSGRSEHGGAGQCFDAMLQRGLVDHRGGLSLTPFGRLVAARLRRSDC